jgi:hypothetical protein
MPSYALRDPWVPYVVEAKVRRAFAAGILRPRRAPHA